MIGTPVHMKDPQTTEDLSKMIAVIEEKAAILFSVKKLIKEYATLHSMHLKSLQAIRADYLSTITTLKHTFLLAVRSFLCDQSSKFPQVMHKAVVIDGRKNLVVDYIMDPIKFLFEKAFLKASHPDSFVIQFESTDMQGFDMLSISMELNRLARELVPLEKYSFVLTNKHDPENLIITIGLKK